MQPSYPRKFNILVAAITSPSDPSRGPEGNPKVARGGFTLQQILTPDGKSRIGGPIVVPPPPSALNHTLAIEVSTSDFWDPEVTDPAPLYLTEEVGLFDRYIVAGEEFGSTHGSGAGPLNTIATQLALALNSYSEVQAVAVGAIVYITSLRPDGRVPVQATDNMSILLGGTPFLVYGSDGVLLSTGLNRQKTYFVVKPYKTQSAPISLLPISP